MHSTETNWKMETVERRQIPRHDQPGFSPFALDCITLARMRHPARHPERRAVLHGEPPRPRSHRTGPVRAPYATRARSRPSAAAAQHGRGCGARPPAPPFPPRRRPRSPRRWPGNALLPPPPAAGPAPPARLPAGPPRAAASAGRRRASVLRHRAERGAACRERREGSVRLLLGGGAAARGPREERGAAAMDWGGGDCRPGAEVSACCLLLSSSSLRRLREERFPLVRFQNEKGLLRGEGIDVVLKRAAVVLLGDGRDGRHREVGIFCWLQKKNRKGRAAAATAKMTFSRDAGLLSALLQLQPFSLNSGIALPSPDPKTSVRAAPSRRAVLPIPFGCAFGREPSGTALLSGLCSSPGATSGCWVLQPRLLVARVLCFVRACEGSGSVMASVCTCARLRCWATSSMVCSHLHFEWGIPLCAPNTSVSLQIYR